MNRLDDRELEDAIRSALADRAAAMETPTPRGLAEPEGVSRPRSPRRLVIAGAVLFVAIVVGIGFWANRERPSTSRVSSAPRVDGREQVILHEVPVTAEVRDALVGQGFDFGTDTDPVAVRPEGHRPFVVLATSPITPPYTALQAPTIQGCVAVVTQSDDGFGQPSRSCFQTGAVARPAIIPEFNVLDLHADARDELSYFTWTDVPPDATRVTFDSETLHAWQVPIRGVAVFPVPVDQGPTLRAFAADGRLLGEQTVEAPEFPSAGYIGPNPAWYDLDATLRFCRKAPIDQVDFFVGGERGRYRMADPRTGFADVDARELCAQVMKLRPEPQSDIGSSWSVANGAIKISYFRLIDPNAPDTDANRSAVSDAEVRAVNAARRAEVAPICRSKSKASQAIPACQIGG